MSSLHASINNPDIQANLTTVDHPLDAFDRFMLQTDVNRLAERYSQDGVKQARSYLKSIFDEAAEQEFLV